MTRGSIVLIALIVGIVAAFLTYQFLTRERQRAAQLTQKVKVVVATQPIAARTVIDASAVSLQDRPVGMLPPNCATSLEEVVGQVAVSQMRADEPVARAAVSPRTSSLGLAYAVPSGMRAVAVALDPIIGVAGFLKAGDRVDVLSTFTVDELKVTKTVLQDVTLLAIGAEMNAAAPEKRRLNEKPEAKVQPNATLAVTPTQAEILILAESRGKLRLALRPADDRAVATLPGVRSDALIGVRVPAPARAAAAPPTHSAPPATVQSTPVPLPQPRPRPAPAPRRAPSGFSIETIRGTHRTSVEVSGQ